MNKMPMPYDTVEERQAYLWAHPEDGRISGWATGENSSESTLLFVDVVDRTWLVDTSELTMANLNLLTSGDQVRLIGEADVTTTPHMFYACAVHPWMHTKEIPIQEVLENREKLQDTKRWFNAVHSEKTPMRCTEILRRLSRN